MLFIYLQYVPEVGGHRGEDDLVRVQCGAVRAGQSHVHKVLKVQIINDRTAYNRKAGLYIYPPLGGGQNEYMHQEEKNFVKYLYIFQRGKKKDFLKDGGKEM